MTPRPAEWLDANIAYCEAAIRYMTKYPATEPDQAAQDKKDLVSTRSWLAEPSTDEEKKIGRPELLPTTQEQRGDMSDSPACMAESMDGHKHTASVTEYFGLCVRGHRRRGWICDACARPLKVRGPAAVTCADCREDDPRPRVLIPADRWDEMEPDEDSRPNG